jgi:WD40 repeat protein/tetratricopeptide (TPR) repeat protein/predicted Ser/Thr protein kinase
MHLVDRLCDEYESCWKSGQVPHLETFLDRAPPASRNALFQQLLVLEVEYRRDLGQAPSVSEYLERFPEFADVIRQASDSIELRAETEDYQTIPVEPGAHDKMPRRTDAAQLDETPKNQETVSLARSIDLSTQSPRDEEFRSHARPLHAGQREFGDYILEEEIARGGMGVVYRAVQKRLNRTVAVKMILSGNLASEQEVRRFYTEAEAAAHLDHPGIVPIYEVNEVNGQHFFSMGYVDGESLADRLKQGPLPAKEAAEIVRQTAEAIAYAHSHGVVHRDLKPSNILMTRDGRPRVTDFGLAKTVRGDSNLTASGQILGTPNYMPPEQALGDIHAVGPHSDVYSLGAVLYCLLTARPPFQAATPIETLRQVIEREPARPRLLNSAVDVDLETICLKCLEKDKTHRIESAAELAAELERYLKGEPIRSRRIGPATRGWRWVKRNRAVAASILLLIVLLAAIPLGVQIARRANESRELSSAASAVESNLAQIELTPEFLHRTDSLIAGVERLDPEIAAGFRERLQDAWTAQIDRSLRRPRLRDQDIQQVENALVLLDERDAEAASRLTNLLNQRKSQVQEAFRLDAPFAESNEVFAAGMVEARGGKLYAEYEKPAPEQATPPEGPPVKTIATRVLSRARSQMEARFDESWEQSIEIGLSLNHAEAFGYDFVLFANIRSSDEAEVPMRAEHAPPAARPTFAQARGQGGHLVVEIRRNGSPAQRREMVLESLPAGPLRLWVKREGGRLRLQINQGEMIEFVDPFPLAESRSGVFAIRWPEEAGLLSLAASEELRPGPITPLEHADAHFEEGRYDEALAIYNAQALELVDAEFQQEARFKRGLCLVRLNRPDEAIQIFQPLLGETGERWPPQAGVQLWLALLRQERHADADAVYELLASRYTFEQLALTVPADVRSEILQSYLREMQSLYNVLSYRPERLRNLERAAAIDRLLSYDGRGDMMTQIELSRGYRYTGDLNSALQILEPIVRTTSHTVPWRHYLRCLRQMGQHDKALAECNRWMAAPDADHVRVSALINRACIYAAQENGRAAEADVLEGLDFVRKSGRHTDEASFFYLMAGFLCENRGDEPGAQSWWKEGFGEQRWVLETSAVASTGYVNVLLLGALCGELSDDEVMSFTQKAGGGINSPIVSLAMQFLDRKALGNTARRAVITPRGRQVARDFSFDVFSLGERIQAPVKLAGAGFAVQTAFGGNVWPEQEQILWDLGGAGYQRFTVEGTLTTPQVLQLGFTWKGTSNLLGWQGVASSLDPEFRAPLAYVLAHRFVRLSDLAQAEKFLQTALRDAPPGETLAKLAEEELQLLQAKQARLRIERRPPPAADDPPLEIVVRRDGQEVQRLALDGKAEIDLEAGTYELTCETQNANFAVSPQRMNLAPADRALVAVESPWRDPPPQAALPGLLAQPADLPGIGRWQLIGADTWTNLTAMAYSPDGKWLAVAGGWQDGIVRVYDRQLHLTAALPATTKYIRTLSWSPDSTRLAVAGQDLEVDIWDPVQARVVARLAGMKAGAMSVAWSPLGDRIVTGHWDDSLCLWDSQGRLLSEQNPRWSDVLHLAWRPDGGEVVFAVNAAPSVARWDIETGAIERLPDAASDIRDIAFSPDGTRLAVLASHALEIWEWPARLRLRSFPLDAAYLSPAIWTADGGAVWVRSHGAMHRFDVGSSSEEPAETISIGGDGPMAIDPQTGDPTGAFWGRVVMQPGRDGAAPPAIFQAHGIRDLAFHPSGETFIAAGDPQMVRWFDRNGHLLREVETPGHPRTVAYSSDGATVAVPCDNGMLRLHSDEDGALLREWMAHEAPAQAAAFDPAGERIATCGEDKTVRLWSLTGEPLPLAGGDTARERAFTLLAFNPDGSRLLAANPTGDVILWDKEGRAIAEFQVQGGVRAVAWRGDGKKLALGADNAVRLYSPDGGEEGVVTERVGTVVACAWTAAGELLAVAETGHFRTWSETGELRDEWGGGMSGWRVAAFNPQSTQWVLSWDRGRLESWRLSDRRPAFTTILVEDKVFRFDGRGRLQNDMPNIAPLLYLVETPEGFRIQNHQEFAARVKWGEE